MIDIYTEQIQLLVFVIVTLPLLFKKVPVKCSALILTLYVASGFIYSGINTTNIISTIVMVCLYFLLKTKKVKSLLYIMATGLMLNSTIGYEVMAILIVVEIVSYYFSENKDFIKLPLLFVFLVTMIFIMQITGSLNYVDIYSFSALVTIYFILHLFYFEKNERSLAVDFIQNIVLTFSLMNILDANIDGINKMMLLLIMGFIGIKLLLYFWGKPDNRYTFKITLLFSFAYILLTSGENIVEIQLILIFGYFLSSIDLNSRYIKKLRKNFLLTPSPFNLYFIGLVLLFSSESDNVKVLKVLLCLVYFVPFLLLKKQEPLVLES